jgi:hypothetical protein
MRETLTLQARFRSPSGATQSSSLVLHQNKNLFASPLVLLTSARTKETPTNRKRAKREESRAYRLVIPCSLTKILANGGAETEIGRRRANGGPHHNPWSEGMREKEAGSGKWFWTPD